MAPSHGLVHLKEYDWRDSNVALVGSELDHRVKHASAESEPAWHDGHVGKQAGLRVWRIENFEVIPWPETQYGQFFDGDSYIVLHSYRLGKEDADDGPVKLGHDIFFFLGAHTSQDEAGVAAYKTVELDELLGGIATQHRELQASPSPEFVSLFPSGITVRKGGVRSGFRHVELNADENAPPAEPTLLRVARLVRQQPVVVEVPASVSSLDDGDVFILDTTDPVDGKRKIWVWQGKGSSPAERARAAQVVHDMTLATHVAVEVVAQGVDSRAGLVVKALPDGEAEERREGFACALPSEVGGDSETTQQLQRQQQLPKRLFRLSDASGELRFELVADSSQGDEIHGSALDSNDVFVFDDGGKELWVWEGLGASRAEKARWLRVAQAYAKDQAEKTAKAAAADAYLAAPIAKVREGSEGPTFWMSIEA